jgi:hypothetical protein
LHSCVNNADFDQVDLDAEPRYVFPLVFFELNQLDFIDETTNAELTFVTDVTDVELFESSFVRDHLIRIDFIYEIRKNFNRGFTFNLLFLDDAGNTTFAFDPISINSGLDAIDATQIVDTGANPEIFNTTQIRVTIGITSSSTPLDPDVEQTLSLKSLARFYLRY